MKLKYKFEILEMDGQFRAVPVGENADSFHGILELNDVAAKMLRYIDECDTPQQVHQKLCADYPDDDKKDIGDKLCDFLNQLYIQGMLE